jgi:branched-chain amino acid transport system permease protein
MDLIETWWAIYSNVVLTIGINGLLALSIWLTLACGMLSIGNAAFMGVGAYTAALVTMNLGWPFPLALVAGMVTPAALAFAIGKPTLRLSGIYLAMATLGFGEVVRITLLNWESLTGGALGLNAIPQLTTGWHVAIGLALVVVLLWRLRRSKVGRAFEAIKEDETAAGLMGIDVPNTKLFAFVLGAPHVLHRSAGIRLRSRRRDPDDGGAGRCRQPAGSDRRRRDPHAPARAVAQPA